MESKKVLEMVGVGCSRVCSIREDINQSRPWRRPILCYIVQVYKTSSEALSFHKNKVSFSPEIKVSQSISFPNWFYFQPARLMSWLEKPGFSNGARLLLADLYWSSGIGLKLSAQLWLRLISPPLFQGLNTCELFQGNVLLHAKNTVTYFTVIQCTQYHSLY